MGMCRFLALLALLLPCGCGKGPTAAERLERLRSSGHLIALLWAETSGDGNYVTNVLVVDSLGGVSYTFLEAGKAKRATLALDAEALEGLKRRVLTDEVLALEGMYKSNVESTVGGTVTLAFIVSGRTKTVVCFNTVPDAMARLSDYVHKEILGRHKDAIAAGRAIPVEDEAIQEAFLMLIQGQSDPEQSFPK